MIKSLIILILLIGSIQLSLTQQNLCTTDPTVLRVADPSDCSLYLQCRRDGSNPSIVTLVSQESCLGKNADYFSDTVRQCVETNTHCSAPLSLCPPASQQDIMIADTTDPECRRHRLCRLPGMSYMTCTPPLVFNRNTGACDFAHNAPCRPINIHPTCPPNSNGNYPGVTCYQFIFCFNGDILGTFECGRGLKFDPISRLCVVDDLHSCIRSTLNGIVRMTKYF